MSGEHEEKGTSRPASPACYAQDFPDWFAQESPFRLKRVYDEPGPGDGLRALVDRLWPRGLSKAEAHLDVWLRDIAPPTDLRRWYHHDPGNWAEFCRRYHIWLKEDAGARDGLTLLRSKASEGPVTLLYAARDTHRNNAVALAGYLAALDREKSD